MQPIACAAGRSVTDALSDAAETVATDTHAVTTKYLPLTRLANASGQDYW